MDRSERRVGVLKGRLPKEIGESLGDRRIVELAHSPVGNALSDPDRRVGTVSWPENGLGPHEATDPVVGGIEARVVKDHEESEMGVTRCPLCRNSPIEPG